MCCHHDPKIPCKTLKNRFSGNFKSFPPCLQKFGDDECQKIVENLLFSQISQKIVLKRAARAKRFQWSWFRSSRSQMFFKIGVLENCAIFTRKHLCWSLFLIKFSKKFIKNFIKKRLQHRCFPANIAKFLRTTFFIQHLWWLLLMFLTLL